MLTVLGDGHRAGPGRGLGGRPAGGQALAAGGAAHLGGPRRRHGNGPVHHFHHVQQQTAHHGTGAGGGELHRVPAAGEFARGLRETAAADLEAIYGLDFITALADGSLPEKDFAYYLGQDALYLNGYSRVLSRAAAIAPTEAEQLFWSRSAQNCLEVESELHRTWLRGRTAERTLGPVTKSYVDHLLAASVSGSYGVLIAAVLPCFWLYAEVGTGAARPVPRRGRAGGAPLRRVAAHLRRRGVRRRHPAGDRATPTPRPGRPHRANGTP